MIGAFRVAQAAAVPLYNWAFVGGGSTGTGDAGITNATYIYSLGNAVYTAQTNINNAVINAAGFGNQAYGWLIGGYTGAANANQNNRYTNSNGSTMTQRNQTNTGITVQNGWKGSCALGGAFGYVWGGTFVNTVYKMNTFNMAWTTPATTLPANNGWMAAHNNATYGIISGGYNGSANLNTNTIWTFSADTQAGGTVLATATRDTCSTGDQTYSYLYCGTTTVVVNTVRKLQISNGAQPTSFSSATALRFAEGAGSDIKGAFFGGQSGLPGSTLTTVREITYSNDSTTTAGTALATTTAQMCAWSGAQTS